MDLRISGGAPLTGEAWVPADKSILHRALIIAAIAEGESRITAADPGQDNLTTAAALGALGVGITRTGSGFVVEGRGLAGLEVPRAPIDCGNSGTTMRMLAGLLAGAGIDAVLTGDASLSRRPMARVCEPLRELGARINGDPGDGGERPPLRIEAGELRGGEFRTAVASAQVKSALLLAGVMAGRPVTVTEPHRSRDHTERLLTACGVPVSANTSPEGHRVQVAGDVGPSPLTLEVPGDPSSAAFLIAAATLVAGSRLSIPNVGLNPTRTGALEILEELGGGPRVIGWQELGGEPRGRLEIAPVELVSSRYGAHPTVIDAEIAPRLIDELPVLAALATQARGAFVVRDAGELRVKESDRVAETVRLLAAFGVTAEERPDGLTLVGPQPLVSADVDVSSDHRIALTAAVLALAAPGQSVLRGFDIAAVSFPGFVATIEAVGAKLQS